MKRISLALLAALSCQTLFAAEPLQNIEVLEGDLKKCFVKSGKAPTCLQTLLPKYLLPGNEKLIPISAQIDDLVVKWLDGQTIFAVHSIKQRKAGDYFEKRSYIIEDTTGSPMTMNISFIRQLGKLYVFSFNVSSSDEKISQLLGDNE